MGQMLMASFENRDNANKAQAELEQSRFMHGEISPSALTAMGLSREAAAVYDKFVQKGGVVVGLTGRGQTTAKAKKILEKHGAKNVSLIDLYAKLSRDGFGPNRHRPSFGERPDPREKNK